MFAFAGLWLTRAWRYTLPKTCYTKPLKGHWALTGHRSCSSLRSRLSATARELDDKIFPGTENDNDTAALATNAGK